MKVMEALASVALLLLVASATSDASALQDACRSFAAKHANVGYDYCVRFFQADGASAAADVRGLAAIAVRITGEAAKRTAKHVAALRASEKDGRRRRCLGDCAEIYSDAAAEMGAAAKGVASGTAAGLGDAMTALSAVMDAPGTCEQGFQDLGVPSPLAAEDAEVRREASVALSVTAALAAAS